MDNSSCENRHSVRQAVRGVLAADLACVEQAFLGNGIEIVEFAERPGRRHFPLREKHLTIATMGAGVVVSCHSDRVTWLQANLAHLHRDAIFSAAAIARLAQYVEAEGQVLLGPDLKYACSRVDLHPVDAPDHVDISVVAGDDVRQLYHYPGFTNALLYHDDANRPDVLATVAMRGGEVVGIAGASADCDVLWQIGVDVVVSARGIGIGRALVGQLTREILRAGRVPYYSTAVSNLPSRALAMSLGYWPCWVEIGARSQ